MAIKMQAAVVEQFGKPLVLREWEIPAPGAGQILVRLPPGDFPPPPLEQNDARHSSHDLRYARLPAAIIPGSESLKDTVERVLPYWIDMIAPALLQGQKCWSSRMGTAYAASLRC